MLRTISVKKNRWAKKSKLTWDPSVRFFFPKVEVAFPTEVKRWVKYVTQKGILSKAQAWARVNDRWEKITKRINEEEYEGKFLGCYRIKPSWYHWHESTLNSEETMRRRISEIRVEDPFKDLLPIDQQILKSIEEDMVKHGFDEAHPIVIWTERGILLDGHTRIEAAKRLFGDDYAIPIIEKSFASEEDALAYVFHQKDRRNWSDPIILRAVEKVDQRFVVQRNENGKFTAAGDQATGGRSAQRTAKIIGISRDKVEKCRGILAADEEIKLAVLTQGISINQAYNRIMDRKPSRKQDTTKFISDYPVSGKVIDVKGKELEEFDWIIGGKGNEIFEEGLGDALLQTQGDYIYLDREDLAEPPLDSVPAQNDPHMARTRRAKTEKEPSNEGK
jgi:hypothetical protein